MRLLGLVLLIAALGSAQDAAQQQQATVVSGDAAAATVDSLTDASDTPTDTTNGTATDAAGTKPRFPTRDEILGQMPPVLPVRSGIPPVDAFYLMFPALSSLLRWGSLFPAQSILGAMPDNLQQSASKVVLVLADDANAQKSRVTRQNAPIVPPNPLNAPVMLQQLLSQMPQPNLGQSWLPDGLVGQMPPLPALPNIQDFNLGQPLAGLQLPPLDGLLGAPPPAPATVTPPPPPAAAAKAATDDVAQAPPAVAQAPPAPFAGFFDGTNNMLGSALAAMPQAPTPDAFMAGLRQFWPGAAPAAAADATAQASDISEVRVKPETPESSSIINYRDPEQREAQLAQLKLKSALQMEQDKQRVPLLWFRMPATSSNTKTTNSPTEQREIETKLQMFERQVIAELKLLQQIEALAREMRANAQEGGRQQQQQPSYKLRYPLSRTPVHKITRSDIERALRDDYVRRLLNKEAQRKVQGSAAFKRQATTPQQTLSKEDIVNVMAYAYRLANEKQRAAATAEATPQMQQQQRQFDAAEQQAVKEKTQQQQQQQEMIMRQMMSQPMEQQQQQLLMQRQWMEEQAKRQQQQAQQEAMARQMETMQRQAAIDQQQQQQLAERQWADAKMRAMQQQRQWTEETMKLKQQQQQLQQQAQQQRQWTEEAMKQQTMQQQQQQPGMEQQQQLRQWEQPAERQWADEKMKAMRQQAEQQRQWSEESIRQQQQQQQRQQQQAEQQQQMRQWTEDATKLKQQQQAEQMRQWTEDATKLKQQQQQQAEQQQLRQWEQAEDQQQQPRQWTEDATKVKQQEQQQQAEQQPMRMETDGDGLMVGEATPQMPETDGKERHKVDVLGLGGNHHKKVKSKVAPTIINYYQQAPPPRPVAYQYAPPAPSSYGTSYGGGGYGSNAYGGYRAAVGNDAIDSMLREHQVLAAAIKPPTDDNSNSNTTTATLTTDDDNNNHRIQKSQSSASTSTSSHPSATTTTTSTSSTGEESDALLGAPKGFSDNLLRPYMGLLPIAQPHDPWTEKAFNPQHALYGGGGSYEPYLRPRRDTHIMPTPVQSHQLLTPGMLERLLRIKAEFQRRFPHLYQGMLNHQTNQTRVVVKPPLLVRNEPKLKSDSTPVYELGAAERGLFDEPSSDVEATSERIVEKKNKQHRGDDNDDDDVDFFRFEDEDLEDNNDHDHHNNDNDKDVEPFDD
ncbi:defective chorion protein, FC125 isoform [Drosophila sulfurigaster albostrigata]|uniref:defective chorion protein, FC125 isoform n=1 Tax=Drosophila sulfurigaster albostrigata TaxID=89887 RepID=UPI002D21D194|nr:defective chorion protein, FC125 isoform [Drosophila sulfurigaster albostrigata]